MEETIEDYKNWYTLQTQGGREKKVEESINLMIEDKLVKNVIQTYVPTEEVISISEKGNKNILDKPIYPGYVFIKMNYDTTDVVTLLRLPFVQRFIGTKDSPVMMTILEIQKILAHKTKARVTKYRLTFESGDFVRITQGAFTDYKGEVDTVNHEQNEVIIKVKFLGRDTEMTVPLHDIEKIDSI
jgi:transcriptional antiterminator NusG